MSAEALQSAYFSRCPYATSVGYNGGAVQALPNSGVRTNIWVGKDRLGVNYFDGGIRDLYILNGNGALVGSYPFTQTPQSDNGTLNNAVSINVTTPATLEQAARINAFSTTEDITYDITDTATNLVSISDEVLSKAGTLIATSNANVAEANTFSVLSNPVVYNLTDTAVNILGGSIVAQNEALNITVTDTITLAQLATLEALRNRGTNTYNIRDTAANLASSTNEVLSLAGTVTTSDAATPSASKDDASPSRPLSPPGGLMELTDASLQRGRQG